MLRATLARRDAIDNTVAEIAQRFGLDAEDVMVVRWSYNWNCC